MNWISILSGTDWTHSIGFSIASIAIISFLGVSFAGLLSNHAAVKDGLLLSALVACLIVPMVGLFTAIRQVSIIAFPVAIHLSTAAIPVPGIQRFDDTASVRLRESDSQSNDTNSENFESKPSTTELSEQQRARLAMNGRMDSALSPVQATQYLTIVVWSLGTVFLFASAWRSYRRGWAIRIRSIPIESVLLTQNVSIALNQVGLRQLPKILSSDEIRTPVVHGVLDPAVILPKKSIHEISSEQIRDVLVHEFAHIRRCDTLVVIAEMIARSLLWPIFTVHWMIHALNRTREDVCDNFVLQHRKPVDYAETLLKLAEVAGGRPTTIPGVGILNWRGAFEKRIEGLLNERRSRRRTLSPKIYALLLMFFISSGISLTGLRLVVAGAADVFSNVQGQLLLSDGSPATGAKIVVQEVTINSGQLNVAERDTRTLLTVPVGTDGSFSFRAPLYSAYPFSANGVRNSAHGTLAQTRNWFAFGVMQKNPVVAAWEINDADGVRVLNGRFPGEGPSINGRLVDIDGQPIVGATVRIVEIASPNSSLKGWVEEVKQNAVHVPAEGKQDSVAFPAKGYISSQAMELLGLKFETQTNQDGRFSFSRLGADQLFILRVTGDHICQTFLKAVSRDFESVNDAWKLPSHTDGKIHGCRFQTVIEPGKDLEGTVIDSESRQPISGMPLTLTAVNDPSSRLFGLSREAISDERGQYKFPGIPQDDIAHCTATIRINPREASYFPDFRVADLGKSELNIDFELKPAKSLQGRLRNSSSGDGIPGIIAWFPGNHAEKLNLYQRDAIAVFRWTDNEGRFHIPAESGKGVLAVLASDIYRYKHKESTLKNFDKYALSVLGTLFHNVSPRDLSANDFDQSQDVFLDPDETFPIKFTDDSGKPMDVVFLSNHIPKRSGWDLGWQLVGNVPIRGEHTDVLGLKNNESRTILARSVDGKCGGRFVINREMWTTSSTLELQLAPCAKLRGQLLDKNARPIASELVMLSSAHASASEVVGGAITDKFGYFTMRDIIPGAEFEVFYNDQKTTFGPVSVGTVGPLGEGEVIELRPVQLKN